MHSNIDMITKEYSTPEVPTIEDSRFIHSKFC